MKDMRALKMTLFDNAVNLTEANMLIGEAVESAYLALPPEDKKQIDDACNRIKTYAKKRGKSITKRTALELLAAIGDLLNNHKIKKED